MARRFQNKLGTSRAALPITIVFSIILWSTYLITDIKLWPSFILFLMTTYLMIELNNRNALMRQYSRMVSCSYMAMMMMFPQLLTNTSLMIIQFCFTACISLLFMTYQQRDDMGHRYWAYIFIGITAVIWPPIIYLVPFLWICESLYLMSLSIRAISASILGILTPFWVMIPVVMYTNTYKQAQDHFASYLPDEKIIESFSQPSSLIPHDLPLPFEHSLTAIFVILLLAIGIVHYFRQSYSDKIHVRMLYQFFTFIAVVSVVMLLIAYILPVHSIPSLYIFLSIIIVCTSPLIAHFITFSSTRISNISVIIILLIAISTMTYMCVMNNKANVMTLIQ